MQICSAKPTARASDSQTSEALGCTAHTYKNVDIDIDSQTSEALCCSAHTYKNVDIDIDSQTSEALADVYTCMYVCT